MEAEVKYTSVEEGGGVGCEDVLQGCRSSGEAAFKGAQVSGGCGDSQWFCPSTTAFKTS